MISYNMVMAGFGGQGVLFSGKVIAYAGLIEGRNVSWLPSYGPEMRGGTANCSICVSDEPIGSPLVITPNVLIAMNEPSYDRFINSVEAGGTVIIDSTLIAKKCERTDVKVFYVPATELASEKGLEGLANIILVGKLLHENGFSKYESVRKAIEKCVSARKQHLQLKNIEAIDLGMSL
ncbi:MAG: 2-oxoacid:acceptor oxidoreductase family protein [Hydrogenoanaerobacterium sp.]